MLFQNHKSLLSTPSKCFARIRSWPGTFLFYSSIIFSLLYHLPSAALVMLAIWPCGSPSPRSLLRWSPHKELWSEYWYLLLDPSKCEASSLRIPTKLITSSSTSSYSTPLRCNPTPTFLEITFDRTVSFYEHVSLLKAKFFSGLKVLHSISAFSWCPSKKSLSVFYKLYFGSFSVMLHPDVFFS